MDKATTNKARKIFKQKKLTLIIAAVIILVDAAVIGYAFLQQDEQANEKRIMTIYDRGSKRVIVTDAATVRGVLSAADIEIDYRDTVEPSRDSVLSSKDEDIIIYRSRLVAVVDGKARQTVLTGGTVAKCDFKRCQDETARSKR
jgi:uncharacterized protein YabE (DUF348 family)